MTSAEIARGLAIAQGLLREYVDTLDGRQLEDTQADEITLAQAAVEAAFQEQCGETMRQLRDERDAARAELEKAREASGALVDEIDDLMHESDGVAGLHLNGDVADWSELVPGGRFERLSSLEDVRDLAAKGK